MISVVMPTILGREESCARMCELYRQRTPFELEIITPYGFPNWPAGMNDGIQRATGDFIASAADDLEPLQGWAEAMISCLENNEIPAPQLWDYVKGGPPVNAVDGHVGDLTDFSRVPALTRRMAEQIGVWPEIDYYADNWVSDKGRSFGYQTRLTAGYEFVHHWHQTGRLDAGDWVGRSEPLYRKARAEIGS
jgi:hypothetical protein